MLQFKESQLEKVRVLLSGATPVPWRSREAEKILTGKRLDRETAVHAAEAAVKNVELLEQNGYKIPLFWGVIEEELIAIVKA